MSSKCKECGGTGEILKDITDFGSGEQCKACNGVGHVDENVENAAIKPDNMKEVMRVLGKSQKSSKGVKVSADDLEQQLWVDAALTVLRRDRKDGKDAACYASQVVDGFRKFFKEGK